MLISSLSEETPVDILKWRKARKSNILFPLSKHMCLYRMPDYSPEQMIWAQDRSQVLKTAEGAMATFIQAGPEQQRTSLGTQSRRDREHLHQLAEEYGLVTQSMGNGAQRSLMVYKPQNPGELVQCYARNPPVSIAHWSLMVHKPRTRVVCRATGHIMPQTTCFCLVASGQTLWVINSSNGELLAEEHAEASGQQAMLL